MLKEQRKAAEKHPKVLNSFWTIFKDYWKASGKCPNKNYAH
jgi:hypothetical protein